MPGFEFNQFVKLTEKEAKHLKCSICLNIFNDAISGECGHSFCKSCVEQWIGSKQKGCPECREVFPTRKRSLKMKPNLVIIKSFVFNRNLLANNLVNDLKTKCDFESNGCHEVIEFGLLSAHLKQCEHRICKTCELSIEVSNSHNCVEGLKKSLKDLKEKFDRSEQRVNELTQKYQKSEETIQRTKKTNKEVTTKLKERIEGKVDILNNTLNERENEVKELIEKDIKNEVIIKELTEKYEYCKQEIQKLTEKLNSKEKGIDSSITRIWKSGDSYDNRICDELSEVILQYLSLEDKLRFECVSQQFRRTVFEKHYFLRNREIQKIKSLETIEKLVKKLTKLSEIHFFDNYYNEFAVFNRKFVDIITKNCNNLTKIVLITDKCNEILNKKFIDKFGLTLVSLKIKEYSYKNDIQNNPYLSQLSNIEELIVDCIPDLNGIHFRRLKRLETQRFRKENIKTLKVLIEDNKNTLRHLKISYIEEKGIPFFKILFTSILKLKNLVDLEIDAILLNKRLDTYLRQLSLNCNQLKRYCFCYGIDENNSFEDLLFLKRFKALKRLKLRVINKQFYGKKINESNLSALLKCEAFRELTHLELFINIHPIHLKLPFYASNVFKDIEKYLPKVQSLKIDSTLNNIEFNCNKNTTDILSRLSNLKNIYLLITEESGKHEIKNKLKEKSQRITTCNIDFIDYD